MKLGGILNEAYGRSGKDAHTVEIDLYADPEQEQPQTVYVEAVVYTSPAEYEGGHQYYAGDFEITSLTIAQSFKFKGKIFKQGQAFPVELIPYIEDLEMETEDQFYEYIENKIGDDSMPAPRYYRDSRY